MKIRVFSHAGLLSHPIAKNTPRSFPLLFFILHSLILSPPLTPTPLLSSPALSPHPAAAGNDDGEGFLLPPSSSPFSSIPTLVEGSGNRGGRRRGAMAWIRRRPPSPHAMVVDRHWGGTGMADSAPALAPKRRQTA